MRHPPFLESWPRGAFGGERTLVPVILESDAGTMKLVLGFGRYRLSPIL